MIKITTARYTFFKKTRTNPRLKNRICFDMSQLDKIIDPEQFKEVVSYLKLNNGTFKTTAQNRFIDLDDMLVEMMSENTETTYRVHDMAVSDGVTSFELFEKLTENGIKFEMTASDRFNKLWVQSSFLGVINRIYDAERVFLNGSFMGIYADHALAKKYYLSKKLGRFLAKMPWNPNMSEVLIINPSLRKSGVFEKIKFEDYDIFNFKPDHPFDVVRCMNILNRTYFEDGLIKLAIHQVFESLVDKGILVVGRTNKETGVNDVTFFKKTAGKFHPLKDQGKGSEIKDVILSFDGISESK